MTDLKTLNEIYVDLASWRDMSNDGRCKHPKPKSIQNVLKRKLRKEAKKWIKEMRADGVEPKLFRRFFNLSPKELKENEER